MKSLMTGLPQVLRRMTTGSSMKLLEDVPIRKLFKVMLLTMYFSLTSIIWILLMPVYWLSLLVALATWSLAMLLGEESQATYSSIQTTWRKDGSTSCIDSRDS